jgi:L-rhamnose mutarotase
MNIDMIAFSRIHAIHKGREREYNELYEALYYYMLTYIDECLIDNYLFRDEVENLIGLRNHEDIVDYILNLD